MDRSCATGTASLLLEAATLVCGLEDIHDIVQCSHGYLSILCVSCSATIWDQVVDDSPTGASADRRVRWRRHRPAAELAPQPGASAQCTSREPAERRLRSARSQRSTQSASRLSPGKAAGIGLHAWMADTVLLHHQDGARASLGGYDGLSHAKILDRLDRSRTCFAEIELHLCVIN